MTGFRLAPKAARSRRNPPQRRRVRLGSFLLYSDTGTGSLVLSGSATDFWDKPFDESPSGGLALSGSNLEDFSYLDSAVGSLFILGDIAYLDGFPIFEPSVRQEFWDIDSALSGEVSLTGSCSDSYSGGNEYTEVCSGSITLNGIVSGNNEYTEACPGLITLGGALSETYEHTKILIGTLLLNGTSIDNLGDSVFSDMCVGTITLNGSTEQDRSPVSRRARKARGGLKGIRGTSF